MFLFTTSHESTQKIQAKSFLQAAANSRLTFAAAGTADELLKELDSSPEGLESARIEVSRNQYGNNAITHGKKLSLPKRVAAAFINPFTAVLFGLAGVSACTDIIWAEPGESDPSSVIIIMTMVMISGILRFVQETRSGNAAENLLNMITTTTCVQRKESGESEIPLEEVVVGDIVHLAAGDMIPADMRILQAKDLFISQSALTGESIAVEKVSHPMNNGGDVSLTECPCLAFMGSNVISGSATGVVVATGDSTIFGQMAKSVSTRPVRTSFEKGLNQVSWVLIRFMLVMVPVVLFINGFTKGDWV